MTASFRLAGSGRIERERPLNFYFDGRRYPAYQGDTVASALLASGVRTVGRSFKYHRPRGVLGAGAEEPNALLEVRSGARLEPNTRATTMEVFEGLETRSQNRWPSLAWDLGSVTGLFAPLIAAGFYYKTFMWPSSFWEKLYEPAIRRAAGLGRAAHAPDPDCYHKAHAHADVLVVGAGPAGLAAALSAGRAGARVILCDSDFLLGGRLNGEPRRIGADSGVQWTAQTLAELAALPEVRIMPRTTVFGVYDSMTFGAVERIADHVPAPAPGQPRQVFWRLVVKQLVVATGAVERPIVFGGNDRPGVMLASAVRTYVHRFRVAPSFKVAVFTSTDDGLSTALDLQAEGVRIAAVIDARATIHAELSSALERAGIPHHVDSQVIGTRGGRALDAIVVRPARGRPFTVSADTLAVSGGFDPSFGLTGHLGARPRWDERIHSFVPGDLPRAIHVAGAAAGELSLAAALRGGAAAGAAAAATAGFKARAAGLALEVDQGREFCNVAALWRVAESRGKAFVDFQHDVTDVDIEIAEREGYRSAELLKRYTTLGMATDQGKTSSLNGQAILAALTGRVLADIGTVTARPPATPVAIGAFAGLHRGRHFRPTRVSSTHAWAAEQGATFVETGAWLRPQWYAAPDERDWLDTVSREVRGVRNGVGICDVSTLGKIDVQGADAARFIDRLYCNSMSSLAKGRVRYGLMLREDGIVLDDGTVARFSDDHFVISTTTANAGKVFQHLELASQVFWPELDVQLNSVTEQWAQLAIAGPRSRELLTRLLGAQHDVSDAAVPYLACREIDWQGCKVRLFRVSFSGELAYELAVPSRYGDAAVREVMAAGAAFGIIPYGTEALGVMRIEKGHVAGNELNGTTTAADLGLAKMMSSTKDYIGRALAKRPGLGDPARPSLVGLKPKRAGTRILSGAHLLSMGSEATLENDEGFVSSAAYSPTLEHWIGLGFLRGGLARSGDTVRIHDPLRGIEADAIVTSTTFYDREGSRLRA